MRVEQLSPERLLVLLRANAIDAPLVILPDFTDPLLCRLCLRQIQPNPTASELIERGAIALCIRCANALSEYHAAHFAQEDLLRAEPPLEYPD